MKIQQLKNPVKIQLIIIGILLTFLGLKYWLSDDIEAYHAIKSYERFLRIEQQLLEDSNNRNLHVANDIVQKNPHLRPLVTMAEDISEDIDKLKEYLYDVQDLLLANAGGYHTPVEEWEKLERFDGKETLPKKYYSTRPVKQTFVKDAVADSLAAKWTRCYSRMERITTHFQENLKQDLRDTLLARYDYTLGDLNLLNILKDAESIRKKVKRMDVIHTRLYLESLKHELTLLKVELINHIQECISQHNQPIARHFKIVMNPEKPPKAGEVFKAEIYPVAYIPLDQLDVQSLTVNGKPIEIVDGVGKFEYTPTSRGIKQFNTSIAIKNKFTGKTNVYKRTQKIEVF